MADGPLPAPGPDGAPDPGGEDRTQAGALAFLDRIQIERFDFEPANCESPILPHPHSETEAA